MNDFERKKRELESYISLEYEAMYKKRELESLREKIDDIAEIKGSQISDMPKGGKSRDFTDYINDLVDREDILIKSFQKADYKKWEIENAIDNIKDKEVRMILKMRYIENMSLAKIGYFMYCSKGKVYSKCNQGINEIKL